MYKVEETTFGELKIGSRFCTIHSSAFDGTYHWFKRSSRTAVGLKPCQGPLGRDWDYFSRVDSVRGEVKAS